MTANLKGLIASAIEEIKGERAQIVVIGEDGQTVSLQGRGIKPLLRLYDQKLLKGATVIDKVVGRAAAMVMALGGVKRCFALTVSEGALEVFKQNSIYAEGECVALRIINRTGDGPCPMEDAVSGINQPIEALSAIRRRIAELEVKQD